ncbi:DUF2950 domain-containing protein [Lysobacter sp. TY2-98]|uniref:DUF2950 domain-containing protein n=1 Tax=Lysobacter sp. TY2-98 TaxID=2290922 RepID=UPI000E204061|nr:DUF2950 domain-containing protein [Lysobacter sp. TY2-98]AXK71787.1 DUF2950 domain-containing protein [Lysobacter sp. TY2-98]
MNTSIIKTQAVRVLVVAMLVASPLALAQQAYPTPEAGAQALVDALGNTQADANKLGAVLGSDWKTYVPAQGGPKRSDVDAFLAKYRQKHAFNAASADRSMLTVGDDGWVFPIPLVKKADGWHFDLASGAQEIRNRAIGRNELDVMQALRAYRDAQFDYANEDRDGDRVLEYAQKLISTDGKHDGLYWADDDSGEISPLGPLFGDERPKGDFLGYHYRILTGQGPSAPGGAYDYKLGDNMTRGFGLVAWPAEYGKSGVMTFTISQDGMIFERDLGKGTDAAARAMKTFDPDSGWKEMGDGTATK